MTQVLYTHPLLGRIFRPASWDAMRIYPGGRKATRQPGEFGLVVAVQRRPVMEAGQILRWDTLWVDLSCNERVDSGANRQALQIFGGGASPGAVNTNQFKIIAVASAALTKSKANLSLGSTSAGVTTNEFTTLGLARAAATVITGNYTAPATNGAQFSQLVQYTYTATGAATAYGAGLFDSATVAGSVLYAEDNFSSNAVLATNDTLRVDWTISN